MDRNGKNTSGYLAQCSARHRNLRKSRSEPTSSAQLYNLKTDPGERNNLIIKHPEIAAELKKLLEASKVTGRSRP
jgi:hypothetical protein